MGSLKECIASQCVARRNTTLAGKPRTIIAKLSFYKDKSRIFQYAKNMDRSTKIGVAEDYPKEIDNIRKELLPVLRNAKKENAQAAFNVDKLIINGQIYREQKQKASHFTPGF